MNAESQGPQSDGDERAREFVSYTAGRGTGDMRTGRSAGVVSETVVAARVAWSGLIEPGDPIAAALIGVLGPVEALGWVHRSLCRGAPETVPGLSPATERRLERALGGWAPRWSAADPQRALERIRRLGGRVVVPGSPGWPAGLNDLGPTGPVCLWTRGTRDPRELLERSIAVVGARAATSYGEHATSLIVDGLVAERVTVVSGGAYGVDAAAHRGAVGDGLTVAVLAGGLDRAYPAGNTRLLAEIAETGLLLAEVPPGWAPTRTRFLLRNRIIAAMSRATVVVEAAWRSGALSTAGHAIDLLRPVGAVPGPVTSAQSAGCHRLLRDGAAVCVTDATEVLELVDEAGGHLPADRAVEERSGDGLTGDRRRVFEALPACRGSRPEALTSRAGLGLAEVLAALGTLELSGHVVGEHGVWRRTRRGREQGIGTKRARGPSGCRGSG